MVTTDDGDFQTRFENIPFGVRRGFNQVNSTIGFEFKRHKKNIFISLGVVVLFYLLSLLINMIGEGRGVESPATAAGYLQSYHDMIFSFFIVIIAVMFGGSMIALDYDKQTGNLIFPKITKGRLFVGRLIARYLLSAIAVTAYYILTTVTTAIKYKSLPIETLASFGWALLYMFLVLAMVIFFSSFLKKTSTTIVISLVMILMIFNLTSTILVIAGAEIEPLFILTYYSNIITQSFAMPAERFIEAPLSPNPEGPTGFQWITPSIAGAAVGMIIYSTILLVAAYFLFRRRQQK